MADNVVQSIKNLKKNLEELDTQLLQEQNAAKKLGEMLQTAMKDAGVSVDDFVKAVRNKINSATKANKISLVLELTDVKGRPLTAASIQDEISALTSQGTNPIRINELKELQKIMGDPAKFYDELMGIVNKMSGSKKSGASSEWKEMTRLNNQLKKSILDTRNAIDQQTESIRRQKSELSRLQSLLQRQKNGIVGIDYKSEESKTRAIAKTNAQIKKTEENIRAAEQEVERLNKKLEQTESQTKKVEQNTKRTNQSLSDMLPTLRRLASAFGVAFSVQGLVNFGRKLVETRGEFELQQVALRSILQNKQLADEIWDKTMQAALQSPFTAMQLTKYTKQLAAYRIETDKLFDTTKRLADVSAGLGVDMQRLILAYGQVKAANYLRASEIRQFTEAGVNVLGELSTYLSATRGELISTAQVMDMVQKRMVTFEDVEAIFKRMTDEGGIFYNMQYVQSQTVKGQINKLHDAYDQMLNSIGKGNEGVLKDVVTALNNIVQNWRYWAAAIKSIAFGTIIASLSKLGVTLTGVNVAGIAAGKGMTKLAGGVKTLGVALKGNWLTLAIGAVVALGAELYNLNKRMKDVNAEIDEQNLNLFETKERLEGYQDAIERNNKALEGSTGNEEKLKKKREENAEILAKLKNDYPQLAEGMEMQKNGVIDLTDALKKENEELERQITLNTLMKQSSIFDENFTKDATDLSKEYIKLQQEIIAARAQARNLLVKYGQKELSDTDAYRILKSISQLNPENIIESRKELRKLTQELYEYSRNGAGTTPSFEIRDFYGKYFRDILDVSGSEKELGDEFNKLGEYVGYELEKGLEEAYKEEIEKSGLSTLQWYALNVNKVQKDVNDGVVDIYRFLRESLEKNGQAQGPGMQAFWNNIVKTNYIDPYFKAWKVGMEEVEAGGWRFPMALPTEGGMPNIFAAPKKGGDGSGNIITDDDGSKAKKNASRLISLIREMRAEYDKLSKSAYGYAKSEATVRESYKQSVKEILGKAGITDYDFTTNAGMIAALERVKTYAQKLGPEAAAEVEKYIGQLKTEMTINLQVRIRENFGRQMEDAFGDFQLTLDLEKLDLPHSLLQTMFDIEAVDLAGMRQKLSELSKTLLDENGVMSDDNWKLYNNWLNKIEDKERDMQRQRLKDYSKYLEYQLSERAKLEMEYTKKVAEVQSESAFNDDTRARILRGLQEEYDKKIAKQDWEDFKGSEMYVEMMEDLTRQGTLALEEMRKKLVEIRDNSENLFPRDLKEVVNALQKIDEVVDSRVSPFARIKDLRKDLKDAMKKSGFDNMRDVFAEDKDAKRRYKELKDEYDEIQAVIGAKQQEKEIEEQLGDYRNSSIASLQDLINKKKEEKKSEDKAIASLGERDKSNQQEIESRTQVSNALQGEIDKYESIIKLLKQLEKAQKTIRESSKYGNTDLGLLSVYSDTHKEQMKAAENTTKRIGNITRLWQRLRKAMHEFLEATKEYITQGQQAVSSVYNTIKELGVEVHEIGDQWESLINTLVNGATSIIDAVDKVKDASDSATEATAQAASGQWVKFALTILSVLAQTIGEIAKFRGAIVNKEIREQGEEIADLQAAYDRLERAIEKTFTTATYIGDYNRQIANLRQQISATEAQLAAAKDRKIQDQSEILGYETAINELYDSIEDLQNEMRETFGGVGESSYRSAAEGFVSAWKDAFLETGNGLKGLQDHFDEFLQDWFVKQGTMQAVANYYSSVWDYVNDIVKDGALPTQSQIDRVREMANEAADRSDAYLQAIAGIFNLGGEGSLSGLAASIQGMTEEQADILAGYWNSVRLYTASIDMNVAAIASALGIGSTPETNPMLTQMRILARNTANINNLLQSVVRAGHPMGQAGIKVFINQ